MLHVFTRRSVRCVTSAFLTHSHSQMNTHSVPPLSRLHSSFQSSKSPSSLSSSGKRKIPPLEDPSTFPEWAYEPRDFFRYELIYQSKKSNARVGRIHTPHGTIDTPGYVAVATNGAIKGLDMRDADDAGQQLVFCNSYHLLLQPGPEVIEGEK